MFDKRNKKKAEQLYRQTRKPSSLAAVTKPNSRVAEQFRTLRTNIQFSMTDKNLQTIMFTSSKPSEGKSTISANVAAIFAGQGKKVLIVDADMRMPSVAHTFRLDNRLGLSTLITSNDIELKEAIQHVHDLNLDILTSGIIPPNPSELLDSNRMNEIINELKEMYDLILFDLPPIVSVTDAQIMATKVDGVVMVIRKDVAYTEDVYKAKELLELVDAKVLGAVFNGENDENDQVYSYYGYTDG
jgi:capsular exopolysaccharide synthesis family protein